LRGWIRTLSLLVGLVFCSSFCYGQSLMWQSPSPTSAEAAALLHAVCPSNIQSAPNNSETLLGCKPCPGYTTIGSSQPGMAAKKTFQLHSVIYGSFTAAGVVEAMADFEGCEPHASGFGGSILLRKLHGRWAVVNYTPGLITSACRTYGLKTGRDLLLCEGKDQHMDGASQGIAACDFARQKAAQCQSVFGVLDTRVACGHSAVWSSINKVELRDLNGDGMPDLSLWVTVGQGTFPGVGGSCSANTSHQPIQTYKLDFLFRPSDGNFLPSPDSKVQTERLRALFKDAQEKAVKAILPDSTR
jgi:hypothetical protein